MTIFTTAMLSVTVVPTPAYAACDSTFFGVPAWYRGLTDGACQVKYPGSEEDSTSRFVWTIVLNLLQGAFMIAAYVTIFYILKGGFLYMTTAGSSDGMSSAKKTITNAIIGLIIAILAASIVNAIASII